MTTEPRETLRTMNRCRYCGNPVRGEFCTDACAEALEDLVDDLGDLAPQILAPARRCKCCGGATTIYETCSAECDQVLERLALECDAAFELEEQRS
jgi:predicted nucleic acid-binding Zn ribbon protein